MSPTTLSVISLTDLLDSRKTYNTTNYWPNRNEYSYIFSNILNRKKNIWKIFLVGNTVAFIISDSVLDVFNICAD